MNMIVSRQGHLCNINIKQVLMAKCHNKKKGYFFLPTILSGLKCSETEKNYIDNDAGTMFLWATFVRKMTLYFYRKMSVFETSKYLLIVRFRSSVT